MHPYLALGLAIVCEVIATSALQASQQFTRLPYVAVMVTGYGLAFYLMSLALKTLPVGIVYAVWSGLGIVLISLIGWVGFKQKLDLPAMAGLAMIVGGVVVIQVFSKQRRIRNHTQMKKFLAKHINLYPPLLGAGIRVVRMSDDYTQMDVRMKLTWWNRNIVGTQFGGSLYAMTDPFFMLMLMMQLGKDYIIWDQAAHIRFVRPGRGTVHARFRLSLDEAQAIRAAADEHGRTSPVLRVDVVDDDGHIVAEVDKTVYVRRKPDKATSAA